MACSKYVLTNNTSSNGVYSYQECSNQMWVYDSVLPAGQSCNIWLVSGTYSTATPTLISLENLGTFPFSISPTPTPTVSPTATVTPTTTATPTPTPTPTTP